MFELVSFCTLILAWRDHTVTRIKSSNFTTHSERAKFSYIGLTRSDVSIITSIEFFNIDLFNSSGTAVTVSVRGMLSVSTVKPAMSS